MTIVTIALIRLQYILSTGDGFRLRLAKRPEDTATVRPDGATNPRLRVTGQA